MQDHLVESLHWTNWCHEELHLNCVQDSLTAWCLLGQDRQEAWQGMLYSFLYM